jgi:uncharacterized protein (TIGR02001 family)
MHHLRIFSAILLSFSTLLLVTSVHADELASNEKIALPNKVTVPYTLSGTVSLVSEYMSRGMHMNWRMPALQGSIDFVHNSGWYASLWGSQINDNYYANGVVEVDVLAGFRGSLDKHWGYDLGVGAYFYPGADWGYVKPSPWPSGRYDTVEATFGISYDWFSIKYSHSLTDYYGYDDRTVPLIVYNSGVLGGVKPSQGTRGSGYLEANANVDIGQGFILGLHVARQHVTNSIRLDYSDYRAGITKSLPQGWSASLNYTTTQDAEIYVNFLSAKNNGRTMDVGSAAWVFGINKSI